MGSIEIGNLGVSSDASGTDDDRIARCGYRGTECVGTNHPHDYISVHRFIHDGKPIPVSEHRPPLDVEYSGRLLK